jgi:hypothetical protein
MMTPDFGRSTSPLARRAAAAKRRPPADPRTAPIPRKGTYPRSLNYALHESGSLGLTVFDISRVAASGRVVGSPFLAPRHSHPPPTQSSQRTPGFETSF